MKLILPRSPVLKCEECGSGAEIVLVTKWRDIALCHGCLSVLESIIVAGPTS